MFKVLISEWFVIVLLVIGVRLTTGVDLCASNPCRNGGTCYDEITKYSCACVPGYVGDNCEQDVNECASNPCGNHGMCIDKVNRYSCTCTPLYNGTNCEQEVNLARGQPTWQSSTRYDALSNRAVDGNRDSNYGGGSCTHTVEDQVNPWWAVDLGRPKNVGKVVFYNRQDGYAWRASDFIVGLTNVFPNVQSPTVGRYALCGQHPGAAGAVETVNCSVSSPAARIVIVQLNRTDTLTICELEVYERDIDECALNLSKCEQLCINTPGSYSCSCRSGFTLNTNMYACDDIDECSLNISKCEQLCTNTPGSYSCSCRSGFTLHTDGYTCTDVLPHECSSNNGNCSQICPAGYTLNPNNRTCDDIDECARSNANCSHVCQNTPGSFRCSCLEGFTLSADRMTCKDVSDWPVGAKAAAIVLGVVAAVLALVLIVVLIVCGKRITNLQRQPNEFTRQKGSDVLFSSSSRAETVDPDRIYTEFQIAGDNQANYQTLDAASVTKDEQSYAQIK